MMDSLNRMVSLSETRLVEAFKSSASRGPDALLAQKETMLQGQVLHRWIGIGLIAAGVAISITIVGAVVGIPGVLAGVWLRRAATRNIATIEASYALVVADA